MKFTSFDVGITVADSACKVAFHCRSLSHTVPLTEFVSHCSIGGVCRCTCSIGGVCLTLFHWRSLSVPLAEFVAALVPLAQYVAALCTIGGVCRTLFHWRSLSPILMNRFIRYRVTFSRHLPLSYSLTKTI